MWRLYSFLGDSPTKETSNSLFHFAASFSGEEGGETGEEGGGRVKGGFHFEITVGPSQPLSSRSECGGDMMVQSKCGRGKGRPYLCLPSAEAAKRGEKKKGGSSEEI